MSGASYLTGKLRWIAGAWRGHRGWVPVLAFLTFLATAVTLAYPLVFGHVLEQIRQLADLGAKDGAGDDVQATARTLIGILMAIGAARFVAGFYPAFRALINSRIELATRAKYFGIVLGKGHRFFTRFRTGDVVTRLTDDIAGYPKIAWFCCSGLFRALNSASQVVCCLVVMFWLDASLALYSLIPVPLMVAVFVALNWRLADAVTDQRAAASQTSDYLEAFFSGAAVVQAHNAEDRLADTLADHLRARAKKEVRLAELWVLFSIFFQALNVVGQLVVVLLGGLRVIDGTMTLGDFFSFYLYLGLLLAPMMDLPNLLVTARQAFVCMERLDELHGFDREGEVDRLRGDLPLESFAELQVFDAHFAYAARGEGEAPPVLRGTELTLRAGEQVAVVGEIGAGKTTFLRILAGILPPTRGEARLNGEPLARYRGPSFREAVGYVPQTPILFANSVRENILMGRADDPARLDRALRLAGMRAEVDALEGGLDHTLGPRGGGLSGGQRQRLTIARALYGDPQLLLLDDITAALDAENEERFWEGVAREWPDATVLVVTHRAATAARMERVLTLREGALHRV